MRTIILMIRQAFCKHNWEYEEQDYTARDSYTGRLLRSGIRVSCTCKECGWHKSYWKF